MLFGSERWEGNINDTERARWRATFETFADLLGEACLREGLGPGRVAFTRAANFFAVLNDNGLQLIVDEIPVGGIPQHYYYDRRSEQAESVDQLIQVAVEIFGFRQPVGVSLPLAALDENEIHRRRSLGPLVTRVTEQLVTGELMRRLKCPPGFEHFARYVPAFLSDHPDIDRNVFLMMRFRSGPQYDEIHTVMRSQMALYGLKVLRADDKDYTGDLWANVCLYMLGSRFGVAVFEEIDLREFNPNVALELGFMIAQNKRCLLFKDQRMPNLPTDIVGKLYKEFDSYDIAATIEKGIHLWARDVGLPKKTA